jgi:hypothetical protein
MLQNGVRDTSRVSKFVLAGAHVLAFAGDDVAEDIARQLSLLLVAHPGDDLAQLGQTATKFRSIPNHGAILGIAQGKLWHLFFATAQYSGQPIFDKAVTGDATNAAVLFSERYYLSLQNNIEGLKKLAAHVICAGGRLNPAGVQGLEMMVWDKASGAIHCIDETEINELCAWSERVDKLLADQFLV